MIYETSLLNSWYTGVSLMSNELRDKTTSISHEYRRPLNTKLKALKTFDCPLKGVRIIKIPKLVLRTNTRDALFYCSACVFCHCKLGYMASGAGTNKIVFKKGA